MVDRITIILSEKPPANTGQKADLRRFKFTAAFGELSVHMGQDIILSEIGEDGEQAVLGSYDARAEYHAINDGSGQRDVYLLRPIDPTLSGKVKEHVEKQHGVERDYYRWADQETL